MSAFDLLCGLGVLQIALAGAGLGWAALRGAPAVRVRWGRGLMVAAVVAPLLAQAAPWSAPWRPPLHVWEEIRGSDAPVATLTLPGADAPALAVPAERALDLGLAVGAGLVGLGALGLLRTGLDARRLLRGGVRWRRIRGVEVWVSPAVSTPCTLWLGRPVIVLDPDTFADASARLLAVRHELQHQRAGDAAWAWASAGVAALSALNPVFTWWRRRLSEAEELACDEALLRRGVPPRAYAELLYRTAARALPRPFPSLVTGSPRTLLKRRISLMLKPVHVPSTRLRAALTLPLVLGLALLSDRAIADRRLSPAEVAEVVTALEARTALPVVQNPAVSAALAHLVGSPGGQRFSRSSLEGYRQLGPIFEARLAEAGLPPELSAVVMVESGYRNLSGAELDPSVPPQGRGAGYWMFIPSTARDYGLRVDAEVDERRDMDKETEAAIDLLGDLFAGYGDWGLALAAYNQGPNAVDRAIQQGGSRDVWVLQEKGHLNDYVAQVIAAALVIAHPQWVE